MNLQTKIDRQYKKWKKLSEQESSEDRDRKLDKAYAKLEALFSSKEQFKAYWSSKWDPTIYVTTFNSNHL